MPHVRVYIKEWCPHCQRALALLAAKGLEPEVIDVEEVPDSFQEMVQRAAGRRTVPQIFIDEQHIGGNDDLQDLERSGRLDPLLKSA